MESTVVMTGGTSGLGAHAAARFREVGCRLILGARREATDQDVLPLDLASLESVRHFALGVRRRLGTRPIDVLVLNAGLIRPSADERTEDGIETTFAVNYVAHYLLLRELLGTLAVGATVVLTTSGTHDPQQAAGLAPPRHADASMLAHPELDPGRDSRPAKAGQHAYTAAKLCAILAVRALNARSAAGDHAVRAVAYCPGQVFGTGLAAHLSRRRRVAWSVLGTPASAPLRRFVPTLNVPAVAGARLAELALGTTPLPPDRQYAALRSGRLTWPEPSVLARDDAAAAALWRDSATLVGLPA